MVAVDGGHRLGRLKNRVFLLAHVCCKASIRKCWRSIRPQYCRSPIRHHSSSGVRCLSLPIIDCRCPHVQLKHVSNNQLLTPTSLSSKPSMVVATSTSPRPVTGRSTSEVKSPLPVYFGVTAVGLSFSSAFRMKDRGWAGDTNDDNGFFRCGQCK